MKLKHIFLILIIIYSCTSVPERRIVFLSLKPTVLWDSLGNAQVLVEQYVEFSPGLKNELKIAKSERDYSWDDKSIPKYGLDNFYTCKYDANFESLINKLFYYDFENSYYRKSSSEIGIDDRHMKFIIIQQDKKIKTILYEHNRLPIDLKELDGTINEYLRSSTLVVANKDYSEKIILSLQDSLFKKNPPPPPPLKNVQFNPPILEEEN